MKQLFPPEIIKNSAENYFVQQHTSSRVIYLILLLLLIFLLLLLPILTVDITTQSNGVIRSVDEDNILQSAVYGEVKHAAIFENTTVRQGDTLIVISTHKIDEQINYYQLQKREEIIHMSDLTQLLDTGKLLLASDLFKQESTGFHGKLEEQRVKMVRAEKEFLVAEVLYRKNVIPRMEYEEKCNNHDYELSHYKNICIQQKLVWQSKLTDLGLKVEGFNSGIAQLEREKRQYIITAPIAGTITTNAGIREGNFVVPNQQLGRISPDNKLVVECYVGPSNIGLIRQSMKVRFQFHAYNYNQWGIGSGIVTEISNNVITINSQPFFKVRCSLDQNYLMLKNGSKGFLKKGMTLTGRFMIINRTLFQLLYDKTDNWLNPKISENE